jgi:hypothetical protein
MFFYRVYLRAKSRELGGARNRKYMAFRMRFERIRQHIADVGNVGLATHAVAKRNQKTSRLTNGLLTPVY